MNGEDPSGLGSHQYYPDAHLLGFGQQAAGSNEGIDSSMLSQDQMQEACQMPMTGDDDHSLARFADPGSMQVTPDMSTMRQGSQAQAVSIPAGGYGGWDNSGGATVMGMPQQQSLPDQNQMLMNPDMRLNFQHVSAYSLVQSQMAHHQHHHDYPLIASHQYPGTFPSSNTMAAATQFPPAIEQRNDSLNSAQSIHDLGKFRAFDTQQQGNGSIGSLSQRMHSLDTSNGVASFGNGPSSGLEPTPSPKTEDLPKDKVAIPRNANSGPASKDYRIPARPRPGRKPLETDPDNKRKLQNRHAQRAFRDRRAQRVQELELSMQEMQAEHVKAVTNLKAALDEQCLISKQHLQEAEEWRVKFTKLEEAVATSRLREANRTHGSSSAEEQRYAYLSVPTPPEDTDEMETDFTAMFAKKPAFSLEEDHQMGNTPVEDPCGFCTDTANCACAQFAKERNEQDQQRKSQALPPISEQRASQPVKLKHSTTPSYLEAPTRATGPGQCDMCLMDPERAARCQALARSSSYSGSQTPAGAGAGAVAVASSSTPVKAAMPASDPRMSCTDFFTQAKQRNVQLGLDVLSRVHAYPYTRSGDAGPSHSPAMEIDAHDAAHALAEMSRGLGPNDR